MREAERSLDERLSREETTMLWLILVGGFILFGLLLVDVLRIMMDR
ncbi:MAG: hypothetical protein ACREIK_09235 [Nitrospiraceae bacterium]